MPAMVHYTLILRNLYLIQIIPFKCIQNDFIYRQYKTGNQCSAYLFRISTIQHIHV